MIYTNDKADKSTRKKNFYLEVYGLPLALIVAICGLAAWTRTKNYLTLQDAAYLFIFSMTLVLFVYAFKKRNWLKMPDGSYHNIKCIPPTHKLVLNEPAVYEAEYFYSKKSKTQSLLMGILLIGFSAWLVIKGSKSIVMPVTGDLIGLFLFYIGMKGLLDKTAKLKIAKNGLWTKKLGFVNWDDINYADVVEEKSGNELQQVLEIRLKGTKFEEANQADERLFLSDLAHSDGIELIINNSINNYNKQKELTGFSS